MFDYVGREADSQSTARRSVAAGLTVASAGAIGFVLGLLAWSAVDVARDLSADDAEMVVMVELADPPSEAPPAPPMAKGHGDVRCVADVVIDGRGRPLSARVHSCPTLFHASTADALMRWRFRAPRVKGAAVVSRTSVGVRYVAR